MNAKQWQAIEQAAKVLGLGERATLAEIKRAYHRLSKVHHPDTAPGEQGGEQMYRITAAYERLMHYCADYRFPLRREDAGSDERDIYDPEDWWQARFGQDPVWSGKKTRRR
ncbi:heat shock protein DnaJ domain protein [Desulfobulbus propionicus DSM 2032]|uniref:Heat shock protein DnaJ domain protein n=1 Tax=Desulfobulbus propionicus (strain ATCC 33891 / DSM 2032 / VKM B-1956 / 1pr3) TaxID=577650 RepID=A0A7U3YPW7_DESPD|nr:J domain-containing protein [Desulfobulbus propionicus]ADW19375.1 heat shock protein DnaJ domain protein [Desulfobulbus propionicus DSM 2032]